MADASSPQIVCPACQQAYPWKEKFAGKRAKCKCGAVISFPKTPPARPAEASARRPPPLPAAPKTRRCGSCKAELPSGAILCVQCGFNTETGEKPVKERGEKSAMARGAQSLGIAIAAGAVAALLSGAVWAWIGVSFGMELAIVAWGIGLVVGFTVRVVARDQNEFVGISAVGLTVVGLLIGKLLLFQWGADQFISVLGGTELFAGAAVRERLMNAPQLDPELKAYLEFMESEDENLEWDEERNTPELEAKITAFENLVDQTVDSMTPEEREALSDQEIDKMIAQVPIGERVKAMMSWWDLLFMFLALGSAWKIGSGGED